MTKTSRERPPYWSVPFLLRFLCGMLAIAPLPAVLAQDSVSPVVVVGEELPSSYGAPPAFSRTRFAPTTTAYVLPPGSGLVATIFEGKANRHDKPGYMLTQEVEMGLPYRFGFAVETAFEHFDDETQIKTLSVEGRWALADWNKIPLNPTIFAEYKFGAGRILQEEGMGEDDGMPEARAIRRLTTHLANDDGDDGEEDAKPRLPDAYELRLLLAQDFGEHIEWATNGFFEQEIEGDRGREWGFAQSIVTPLSRNERFKVGVEMLYTNFTDKDTRDDPEHSFVIGPTVAWKPNSWSRVDVSPLFGTTDASPKAQVFVVFSVLFGGPSSSGEAEAPASTRNR